MKKRYKSNRNPGNNIRKSWHVMKKEGRDFQTNKTRKSAIEKESKLNPEKGDEKEEKVVRSPRE